jgi:hypothetical protein
LRLQRIGGCPVAFQILLHLANNNQIKLTVELGDPSDEASNHVELPAEPIKRGSKRVAIAA